MKQSIRLRGISDDIKGKVWESDALLRAGRLGSLEIVLDDSSVSRRHAEVRYAPPAGWVLRDLESTNGTYLNGQRLAGERPVRTKDIVQFGKDSGEIPRDPVPLGGPDQVPHLKERRRRHPARGTGPPHAGARAALARPRRSRASRARRKRLSDS